MMCGPEGRLRAVALLPPRFAPLAIGRARVVGRWVDEPDVHHVRVCRLEKGGGEAD